MKRCWKPLQNKYFLGVSLQGRPRKRQNVGRRPHVPPRPTFRRIMGSQSSLRKSTINFKGAPESRKTPSAGREAAPPRAGSPPWGPRPTFGGISATTRARHGHNMGICVKIMCFHDFYFFSKQYKSIQMHSNHFNSIQTNSN